MQAVWIEDKQLSLRSVEQPVPREHEVLLAVDAAGICGTDLELQRGYYDFTGIPGHEFVATVVSGPQQWQGRRVVSDINIGCGECTLCESGLRKHCEQRRVIGIRHQAGAFCENISVPITNLLEVPDHIEDWQAVLIEPLAAALQILEQVNFTATSRVMIVGAGRLARIIARVLLTRMDRLWVVARSPGRDRDFDTNVTMLRPDEVTPQFDCVIECTGQPSGFELALLATPAMGQIIVKSTYAGPLNLDLSRIVVDEIRLVGSRCGSMHKALDWLGSGQVTLDGFRCRYHPLTAFRQAFRDAEDAEISKVIFKPSAQVSPLFQPLLAIR